MDSLSLPTWKHPQPHCVEWLYGSGKLKVTHKARLKFSCGDYEDTVVCDVLPMGACQLLLDDHDSLIDDLLMKAGPMYMHYGIKGSVMCCSLCLIKISRWMHLK